MPCVTPSQHMPIPPGESLDITQLLTKTNGGSLRKDGEVMVDDDKIEGNLDGYREPNCLMHRADSAAFLRAQATTEFAEVKHLAEKAYGQRFVGGVGGGPSSRNRKRKTLGVGNGEGVDWSEAVEQMLQSDPSIPSNYS